MSKRKILAVLCTGIFFAAAVPIAFFGRNAVGVQATGEPIEQMALSLQSDLAVKIYVAEGVESITAYIADGENRLNEATMSEKKSDENGTYFEYHGVTPQLMGQEIVATAGDYTIRKSVREYCMELLDKTESDLNMTTEKKAELDDLLGDMLNYGAAAQEYTGYKRDDPVNAGLGFETVEERYAALGGEEESGEIVSEPTTAPEGEAYIRGTGAHFDNRVGLYFTVIAPEGPEGLTVRVAKGEMQREEIDQCVSIGGNAYRFLYEGIGIAEYGDDFSAQVYVNGEATGNKTTFSVNDYIFLMDESEDGAMATLAKSLYAFNRSALVYAGISEPIYGYAVTAANISVDAEGKPQLTVTGSLFGYTAEDFTLRYARLDPWPWVYSDIETFEMTTEGGQFTLTADLSFLTTADDKTTSEDGNFYQKYIFYFMLNGEEEKALPFGSGQTFIYNGWEFEVYSEYGNLALKLTEAVSSYSVSAAQIEQDAEGKLQLTITGSLFGYTAEDFTLRYARLDPWPWVYSDIETFEMTTEGGQFTLTADLSFLTTADDKTTSEDGNFYQKYIFYFMLNGEEEKALPFGSGQTFIYNGWEFEVYSEYGNLALRVTEVPQE